MGRHYISWCEWAWFLEDNAMSFPYRRDEIINKAYREFKEIYDITGVKCDVTVNQLVDTLKQGNDENWIIISHFLMGFSGSSPLSLHMILVSH